MYGRECFQGRECLGGECPTLPAAWPGKGMSRRGNVPAAWPGKGMSRRGNVPHFQQHDQGRECPGEECPTLSAAWPGKGMSRWGMSYTSSSMTREANVQEGKCPTLPAAWPGKGMSRRGNVPHFQQHDQRRECLGGECPTLPPAWPGKGMSRRGMSYTSSSMTREGNVQEGNVLHFQQHDHNESSLGGRPKSCPCEVDPRTSKLTFSEPDW